MEILTFISGKLATNCYLIIHENSKKACLIDPAEYNAEVFDIIISKKITLECIILTHWHFDHILGANIFKEKTGAKIIIHEAEHKCLQDMLKNLPAFYDKSKIVVDKYINENDVLSISDISLRVIHTPGHTRGSCCFACEDEKVMFTGDTLFNGSIGRCDFVDGDYDMMLLSLKKLKDLDKNYKVYPGHGDFTTLDFEKENNPYLMQV